MLLSGLAHATATWTMVALTRTYGLYLHALSVSRLRCDYLRRPLRFPQDFFYAQCRWSCYVLWLRFFSVTPLSKEIYINKVRIVGCSMLLWTVHEHVVFGLGRSCACAWVVQVDNSATSLFYGFYSRSTEGTFCASKQHSGCYKLHSHMKASTSLQALQDLSFYKPTNLQNLQTYIQGKECSTAWWP